MLKTFPINLNFRPTQFKSGDIITEQGISTIVFCLIDIEFPVIKLYINKAGTIASFFIYEQPNKIILQLDNVMLLKDLKDWVRHTYHVFDPQESSILI